MPILSFSSNDIDVITGKKTRTIRKAWKTPLKVGDRLYCYWNLVSKEKMKIFEECFFRDIKFIYKKETNSETYIPTKDKIILIN